MLPNAGCARNPGSPSPSLKTKRTPSLIACQKSPLGWQAAGGKAKHLRKTQRKVTDKESIPPAWGGGAALIFRVKNLGKTAKELDGKGVEYETFTGEHVGDCLEVCDPDGYRLTFAERL